ncbi:MAG: MlaD family protein [Myxococcota bacterium]
MNIKTPLVVGLVTVVAASGLGWFLLATSEDQYSDSATYPIYADFSDASGIRWKTRVQINGIDVGKIDGVSHVRGPDRRLVARVKIRLLKEYEVYANASIKKAAESLLGDYRLDLDPGTPDAQKLEEGGIIANVQSLSDLDAIQSELKTVATNVNRVTESLARVLSGPEGEGSLKQILASVERSMTAMERTTETVATTLERNERNLNNMLANLARFSGTLGKVSGDDGELEQIIENLTAMTENMKTISRDVSGMVNNENLDEDRASIRDTLDKLDETIGALASVTQKIDEGKGTAGRIINDDKLINDIEQTVSDAGELVGGLSRLQAEVELRSEWTQPFDATTEQVDAAVKSTLGFRLFPRPDKYYLLELISDPRGVQTRTQFTTEEGGDTGLREVTTTEFNRLRFSAQFAKRYYDLTLRFGIMESTGGIGANVHFLEDSLEFRFDAFDFTRTNPSDANDDFFPRLRGFGMYEVFPHLWVQAGLDDPFNPGLRTYFMGGVLRFTDDDLRSILLVAPTPQ